MGRRNWVWGVLAALIAANTVSATVTATPRAAFRHIYALAADGRVTIQNPYGNVTITAWDRDAVLVEAIKHTSDPRHTDDARIVVDPGPDSLSIRTQYTGADAEHPTSVEYRLTVPRHARLEGVLLTNGQLSLAGLAGPVQAQAINGDIHALKMGGATQLSTVNGRVEANFDSTAPGHSISLSSVNGGIALTLPGGSDANLEAENRSGGIASNLGHVMRTGAGDRLVTRGGGPRIRLHNINGGISIRSERPCT
jgi:DUF4097 and DUF4098 domain-containing protein YvlB